MAGIGKNPAIVIKLSFNINHVPENTIFWGKRGVEQYQYEMGLSDKGCGDFFGPGWRISWWREAWHLFGGVLAGLIVQWYWVGLYNLVIEKEDQKNGQSMLKSILDVFFWIAGAGVGNYIQSVFGG